MTRYFARIDKTTKGPFTLRELIDLGVRPSTYVWAKGMPEWERAEDVADVCRAMRLALAGLPLPGEDEAPGARGGDTPVRMSDLSPADTPRPALRFGFPEPEQHIDFNVKPTGISIVMAIVMTFCCFPVTGAMAVWFAYKFQRLWKESDAETSDPANRHRLRVEAYDMARLYRMMIGITFSIGLILFGVAVTTAR